MSMKPSHAVTFALGRTVITRGALTTLGQNDVRIALARHARGDWGDVCADDRQANDGALTRGGRLLSAYHTPCGTKYWIITEADRSATTVLLPEEY